MVWEKTHRLGWVVLDKGRATVATAPSSISVESSLGHRAQCWGSLMA